ncbi:MAG: tubulin/FtsZ family protein [Methanoregula sp.]|nr:tubulin/FtsZ family protein [Methanoregula sp.]
MRIIAIGIGGAGCRIVNSLYAIDRKNSKVVCVQGLAIDVDEETIKQLTALPENARMCFSALDPGIPDSRGAGRKTAPIDINEIISRVQNLETGENDAIVFCCGLGGSMVDVAPHIIAGLRSSIVEPIFGLVTLPCLAEGERISGKAADDIEMLSSMLDGIIVFDNETWYKKIKAQKAHFPEKEKGFAEKIGLKKSEPPLSSTTATYRNLNEAIVRRIGLILRAGEFRPDGGVNLAEVVLDSGEVLNTMKGMGFITIGYAVEKLPHDPLRFLSWLKPAGIFEEEQKKKASRIVELAKKAIYHEISTPCDLTSAHKALVLVAGPTQELSMKGYMTVRKWIDRSIAGLETRSGDYPIVNTKNVAIIVMLSGLENIPRITELNEIRSQSKPKKRLDMDEASVESTEKDQKNIRDDMITLPVRRAHTEDFGQRIPAHDGAKGYDAVVPTREPVPQKAEVRAEAGDQVPPVTSESLRKAPPRRSVPVPEPVSDGEDGTIADALAPSRRRVVVARPGNEHAYPPSLHSLSAHGSQSTGHKTGISARSSAEAPVRQPDEEIPRSKETERQRIERELRRQRSVAMGQNMPSHSEKSHHPAQETHVIHRSSDPNRTAPEKQIPVQGNESGAVAGEKRTIIIGKRKIVTVPQEKPNPSAEGEKTGGAHPRESVSPADDDGMSVEIRDRVFRAKDEVFEGKGIRKPAVPQARDLSLLHTELRPKKKVSERDSADKDDPRADRTGEDPISMKKRTRSEEKT